MQYIYSAEAALYQARLVRIEDEINRRGIALRGRGTDKCGPCPVCGGVDRFSINVRKNVFHCRRCGVGGDTIALVQHLDGCDFPSAIEILTGGTIARRQPLISSEKLRLQRERRAREQQEDDRRRTIAALRIWDSAGDWRGTDGDAYLRNRCIDVAEIPRDADVRWHPACPWQTGVHPCLVLLLTDTISREPRAIQRIAVARGQKVGKLSLGPSAGTVARLWPDENVKKGLVVGEGVETCLAAATRVHFRGALLRPAWATCGKSNLASLPVLAGVDSLTLLVDHDDAGIAAANQCAQRWRSAGREVFRLTPTAWKADFADIAKGMSR